MSTITMPALSPTMTEGKLARWLVKEGDDVRSGDVIAEIETDKALMEVEALEDGKVSRLMVAEGEDAVAVGAPIAEINGDGSEAVPLVKHHRMRPPTPLKLRPQHKLRRTSCTRRPGCGRKGLFRQYDQYHHT